MAGKDLWGEIPSIEKIPPPVLLLREQADILAEKTEGVLQGRVHITAVPEGQDFLASPVRAALERAMLGVKGKFVASLHIVAPALNSYSIAVVELLYDVKPYPVVVRSKLRDQEKLCSNETELQDALQDILSSQEVKDVIALLLSHSKLASPT